MRSSFDATFDCFRIASSSRVDLLVVLDVARRVERKPRTSSGYAGRTYSCCQRRDCPAIPGNDACLLAQGRRSLGARRSTRWRQCFPGGAELPIEFGDLRPDVVFRSLLLGRCKTNPGQQTNEGQKNANSKPHIPPQLPSNQNIITAIPHAAISQEQTMNKGPFGADGRARGPT